MRTYSSGMKIAAGVTLTFFAWSYGPLFQIPAAWAAQTQESEDKKNFEIRQQRTGEQLEKALEDIREKVGKAEEKSLKNQDITTEIAEVKKRRAEIDSLDVELKKEFAATEKKLKDSNLPKEILDRHYKFVKHYEDNLAELRANLTSIEQSAKGMAFNTAIQKTKNHLDKVKPPKKHVPLDPNKLPHRMVKAKARAPRLKKEEFEKDFPTKKKHKNLAADLRGLMQISDAGTIHKPNREFKSATDKHGWIRPITDSPSRLTPSASPIQLAYNEIASDVPFTLHRPSGERTEVRSDFDISSLTPNVSRFTSTTPSASPVLISQATIDLPIADDLAETPEVQFTQELQQIATLLENNPVQLYEFVRNNFSYDPYYGSVKGSQSTLLLQSGNDFDQASVLIALFRVSGIPARYAYGTVEIPIEKIMKWLGGITDPRTVGTVLTTNGIPAKIIVSGGAIKSVQLEHTWVEAYIAYANYRGLINDPTTSKTWITLDPSFKLTESNFGSTDLADVQQFNIDSYLMSYIQTVKPKTPAKDYLKTTIDYVSTNIPGKRFYDLLVSSTITEKVLGLLPDTLPYPLKTTGAKFSTIPDTYRHRISLEFTNDSSETVLNYTTTWTAVLHNRFSLSYIPATANDEQIVSNYGDLYSTPSYLIKVKPVLMIEGATVVEGTPVPMASDLMFRMNFVLPDGTIDKAVTNILVAGAMYVIGLGSGYTTGRIVTNRTAKLEAAVNEGQIGEPIIGEYLNLLAVNYLQELDSSRKLIAKSMKTLDTNRAAELMVGVDLGVSMVFGIPKTIDIRGILMDVDYNIATPVNMDGDQTKVRRFQILTGMTSSALEHTVFEAIIGVEAVSTIKALEIANVQGIPVHQIDSNNIATKLPLLQLSNEIKTDIQNAVNAGKMVTVSERNIQLNEWNGAGYIVMDLVTGAGAYMISGGKQGGSLTQMTSTLQNWIESGYITKAEAVSLIRHHRDVIWFPAPVSGAIKADYDEIRGDPPHLHQSLDFAVPNWTPVYAVAAGSVKTQMSTTYGKLIIIDHGAGVKTYYAHNCELFVSDDQNVSDGDIIARSGNTGRVSSRGVYVSEDYFRCSNNPNMQAGAHVHFELRLNDIRVDPELYGLKLW